jgi:hypothetical protein
MEKLSMILILLTLSMSSYAKCKLLVTSNSECPNNQDLKVCEDVDVRNGLSVSSAETEFSMKFKALFCGVYRAGDQAYCTYEDLNPRSPYSSGKRLKATLLPIDPGPMPTWDLSGRLDIVLASGRHCSYSIDEDSN